METPKRMRRPHAVERLRVLASARRTTMISQGQAAKARSSVVSVGTTRTSW